MKDLIEKYLIEKSNKEFIVWGIPEGKKDEEILTTKAENMQQAKNVIKVLEKKYNAKKCRIQVIDLSKEYDMYKAFSGTIN